ncbi:FAD/NAD(P)-binding domain-containing protein [Thozetella sp. PMI_491]|nr:FAD/NAD(P)-binding domain-containing protein [Thozetella sp. PMI_491]
MGSRSPKFDVKKVAIIGAGPSGLSAVTYLLAQEAFQSIVIYEQNSEVGGVWHYSARPSETLHVPQVSPFIQPDPPIRPDGVPPIFPTPLYDKLNTNVTRDLIHLSALPFRKDSAIFPSRQHVGQYLVRYADAIRHLIKLSTQVKDIRLRVENGKDQWDLESTSTVTGKSTTTTYDAIVVASGHYSTTYIPDVKNIAQFHQAYPGVITHSKLYRSPTSFSGKKVIVVGNSASGLDIGNQISRVSQQPLLWSVRTPTPPENQHWITGDELPEIVEFLVKERGVKFKNGRIEKDVDAIVYATGYLFSLPFLNSFRPSLLTDGRRVYGLYKDLFHINHPTLVFAGLPIRVNPWTFSESQAAIYSRVWANQLPLPSVEHMEQWEKDEEKKRGPKFHVWPRGADIDFVNSTHEWIARSGTSGRVPPKWSDYVLWQKSILLEARWQFEIQGRVAKSLEELGFIYRPKKCTLDELDRLQIHLHLTL